MVKSKSEGASIWAFSKGDRHNRAYIGICISDILDTRPAEANTSVVEAGTRSKEWGAGRGRQSLGLPLPASDKAAPNKISR